MSCSSRHALDQAHPQDLFKKTTITIDPSGTPVWPQRTPVGPQWDPVGPQWDPSGTPVDPSGTPVGPQWVPSGTPVDPSGRSRNRKPEPGAPRRHQEAPKKHQEAPKRHQKAECFKTTGFHRVLKPQWDPSGTAVGPQWTPVGPRSGRSGPQWDPSGTPGSKCCYFIGFNRVLMILGVEMLLFHWF